MIRRIVTAKLQEHRITEARHWAQELLTYLKEKWPQFSPEVFIENSDDSKRMYLMSQYESMSDLENALVETRIDEWFRAHYIKGKELFVDGSNKSIVLESL